MNAKPVVRHAIPTALAENLNQTLDELLVEAAEIRKAIIRGVVSGDDMVQAKALRVDAESIVESLKRLFGQTRTQP